VVDYYPLLSRAVSRLAVNNAQTRQELYECARTVLVAELERNNPERSPVCIENSNSDIFAMQAPEKCMGPYVSDPLNWPREWCIFVQ
jgi:hypothetical protein